jgi:hypothetical protein
MRTAHHRRFLILGPFGYFDHMGMAAMTKNDALVITLMGSQHDF